MGFLNYSARDAPFGIWMLALPILPLWPNAGAPSWTNFSNTSISFAAHRCSKMISRSSRSGSNRGEGRPLCRPPNYFQSKYEGNKWDGTEAVPPRVLPPLVFRVFSTEFLFDFGIRLFPEGRKILRYLDGPVIWRQDVHDDRDLSVAD